MENFKECSYLPDEYLVSIDGKIKTPRGIVLKPQMSNSGYLFVVIKSKSYFVHRAICFSFLDRIEGSDFVNHKDGNKLNNNLSNLEWCTKSYNVKHSYDSGLKKYRPLHYKGKFGKNHNKSIPIVCDGNEYEGYSDASRKLNINISTIMYRVNSNSSKWANWFVK